MSKHLADHRTAGGRVKLRRFLELARTRRETWHRPRTAAGKSRLVQFLRIERGRTA
jgi:hypothetical protein